MNRTLTLTKVLLKNGGSSVKSTRQKLIYLVVLAAFLPMVMGIGQLVSFLFDTLSMMGQQGVILALALPATVFVIFFFGIMYIMNTFYFSMDIESLLHLPLRPTEILGAKFATVLVYEYLTEAVILIPVLAVYGFKNGESALFYIQAVVIMVLLPVIPLAAAAVLDMVIMRFTNLAKNKDLFRNVSGVLALFLALGLNFYIQSFAEKTTDPAKIMEIVNEGNNSMIQLTTSFFPSTKLAVNSLVIGGASGALYLLLFAVATAIAFAVFLALGNKLYFKGVIGVSETSSKREALSARELGKGTRASHIVYSYTLKELRLLFRTPIYFLNCILMNFLWPLFLIIPFLSQTSAKDQDISALLPYVQGPGAESVTVLAFLAMGIFITGSNIISSTAISREGSSLFFMKFIPVEYRKQLLAKSLSGAVMGFIGIMMMVPFALFVIKIKAYVVAIGIAVSIPGILFSSLFGLLVDIAMPKLNWDTEQKAVKQNLNGVIAIFVSMGVGVLIVIIGVKLQLSLLMSSVLLPVVFGAIDIVLYKTLISFGAKKLRSLDC
ncbi:MAG TPA: transporter [Clostridiaceae bacterium]|nr:transporter [Clostridiaceae bacterium]